MSRVICNFALNLKIYAMSDFIELCNRRFSARKYTAEPVSADDLNYILEAVRLAPSACNKQPWKFIVVKSDEGRQKLQECYARDWFKSAPVYIICMKNTADNWVRASDNKAHGDVDVAIAVEHLCLAAADRGLGTCWICNFLPEKVNEHFGRPDYETVAIIPLGHTAADCPQPEKKRKPLSEITETV